MLSKYNVQHEHKFCLGAPQWFDGLQNWQVWLSEFDRKEASFIWLGKEIGVFTVRRPTLMFGPDGRMDRRTAPFHKQDFAKLSGQ